MMAIKTVIFDLDGTITEPFFDFDAIREEIGLSLDAGTILEIMDTMSHPDRMRTIEIITKHEKNAVEQSTLNNGAKETLQKLRKKGINIGILTRNRRINAEAIAQRHGLIFDAIVDRDDGPVKPDAFGVLHLCSVFGTKPEETLMVGDYLYDLLCAKAARVKSVLLKTHHKADEFAEHADYEIDKLDEILKII